MQSVTGLFVTFIFEILFSEKNEFSLDYSLDLKPD